MITLKNRDGSALITVLIVVLVLGILGASMLTVSVAETRFVEHQARKSQAYYIAHSGADALATYILKNPDGLSRPGLEAFVATIKNDQAEVNYADGHFVVRVEPVIDDIKIVSVGTYQDVSQTVTVTLYKRGLFDNAIYAHHDLTLWSGAKVFGGDVQYGAYYYEGNNAGLVDGQAVLGKLDYPENVFPDPPLPAYDAGSLIIGNHTHITVDALTDDTYLERAYDQITIANNGSLTIDLNGETARITVRQLDAGGTFRVNGPGKLLLYVEESIYFKGVVDSEAQNLIVYVGDYNSVSNPTGNKGYIELKTGDSIFNGYIVGISATVDVTANLVYTGAIIAESVKVASNAEVHYDSENAPSIIPDEIFLPPLGYRMGPWSK